MFLISINEINIEFNKERYLNHSTLPKEANDLDDI